MASAGARPLIDPFGRTVRDLRISITDRCNFRCEYCMPEEGMVWQPREELLTFEEIERVARICVERYGFTGIRLTGGEPLLQPGSFPLMAELSRSQGVLENEQLQVKIDQTTGAITEIKESLV